MFVYCLIRNDHGIEVITFNDLECLNGLPEWMSKEHKEKDEQLLRWAEFADTGDFFEHRNGICFKVNSFEFLNKKFKQHEKQNKLCLKKLV